MVLMGLKAQALASVCVEGSDSGMASGDIDTTLVFPTLSAALQSRDPLILQLLHYWMRSLILKGCPGRRVCWQLP